MIDFKTQCICEGNWRTLVHECDHLFGKKFRERGTGKIVTFFGLVHTDEDYYYGMVYKSGRFTLLSCVGDFETHGYELVE